MARARVLEQQFFPAAADGAEPDAVAPGLRRAGSAPIDDHELIEQRPASSLVLMMRMTMLMRMRVTVSIGAIVAMVDPGTAHVMVMSLLRRAYRVIVPNNARAILAELAIHCRRAGFALVDAIEKGLDDLRVVAQVAGLGEGDLRETGGGGIGLAVDALDQNTGEQEIRKHDDAAEPEQRRTVERRPDKRMRHPAERRLGPPEAE